MDRAPDKIYYDKPFYTGELSPKEYEHNQVFAAIGWEITEEEEVAETESMGVLFAGVDRSSSILDVGFGFGRSLKNFRDMGFNSVKGVDINKSKVDAAKKDYDVVHCDATILPFENESFDFIYSSHSFEHMIEPWNSIDEFLRVLKNDGKIFIIIPYPDNLPYFIHCSTDLIGLNVLDNGATVRNWFENFANVERFEWFARKSKMNRQPEIWLILTKKE